MRPNYMNTVMNVYSDLTDEERKTFRLHIGYSLLDGLITGIFTLNEFVFLKNFHPGSLKLSMLFQLAVLVLPFSIFFTNFFEKVRNKKRLLYKIGLITRAPLLLFFAFPWLRDMGAPEGLLQDIFLSIFLLFYFATPFTLPLINQLLKANYGAEKLGKLYSYSWSINMLTQLVSSILFGMILDAIPGAYVYTYPFLGLLAMLSIYLISQIKSDDLEREYEKMSLLASWKGTLNKTIDILKYNKPFRDFQMGMMIYGIAFLMNLGVVALFLNDILDLNYSEVAGYKGIALGLSIVTFPLFGLLLDRSDPRKFSVMCYRLVIAYFVLLITALVFPFQLTLSGIHIYIFAALAYLCYGFFQSSMNILWGIGSSYFAPSEHAATYQAIHCTLTGFRGIVAPFLGAAIFTVGSYFGKTTGFYTAFGLSVVLLTISIYYTKRSLKHFPRKAVLPDPMI